MATEDNVDRWLSQAFTEYGNALPRLGLENRVLTNLRMEIDRRRVSRTRWRWAAVPIAAVVLLGAWLAYGPRNRDDLSQSHFNIVTGAKLAVVPSTRNPRRHEASQQPERSQRALARRSTANGLHPRVAAAAPTLEQFPSPRPLSQEEALLVAYVNTTPPQQIVSPSLTAKDLGQLQITALHVGNLQTPRLDRESPQTESNATN